MFACCFTFFSYSLFDKASRSMFILTFTFLQLILIVSAQSETILDLFERSLIQENAYCLNVIGTWSYELFIDLPTMGYDIPNFSKELNNCKVSLINLQKETKLQSTFDELSLYLAPNHKSIILLNEDIILEDDILNHKFFTKRLANAVISTTGFEDFHTKPALKIYLPTTGPQYTMQPVTYSPPSKLFHPLKDLWLNFMSLIDHMVSTLFPNVIKNLNGRNFTASATNYAPFFKQTEITLSNGTKIKKQEGIELDLTR